MTENFWREQPIAAALRTFRPSTGLKLTGMGQILGLLGGADLPEHVKQNAAAVFQRLGEVEAGIHRAPVERVHFHDVGGVDSICDIVGACLGLELLGVEAVYCSPLNEFGEFSTEREVEARPEPGQEPQLGRGDG